jgi:hypothetical protein
VITNEKIITCNTIDFNHDGRYVAEETGECFDAEQYSRLKYGSLKAARFMGSILGESLLELAPEDILDETPPEAAVIYKAVPPACDALSRFCIDTINRERIAQGLEPGQVVHVHKSSLVGFEYAASSPEAREKVLDSIAYDPDGHSFDDKPVIVIDDIRITGSAEKRTRKMLDEFKPKAVIFGYIALFNEVAALQDSSVEDRINHSYVKDLNDVLDVWKEDGAILNIRTLKRILSRTEADNRANFLNNTSDDTLYNIYSGALASGPSFVHAADYRDGFKEVEALAQMRGIIKPAAKEVVQYG